MWCVRVVHVASADREMLARAWRRFAEETPLTEALQSANTLMGATVLDYPGQLAEVDLTAMLPGER